MKLIIGQRYDWRKLDYCGLLLRDVEECFAPDGTFLAPPDGSDELRANLPNPMNYPDDVVGLTLAEADARYDWHQCWPIVERGDAGWVVAGVVDGTNPPDGYVLADMEDGELTHIGEGYDVAIEAPDEPDCEEEDEH